MGIFSYSKKLFEFMSQIRDMSIASKLQLAMGTLEIIGDLFYDLFVPSLWQLCDIKRINDHTIIFYWFSGTDQAQCPECMAISHEKSKTYRARFIQDLPILSFV